MAYKDFSPSWINIYTAAGSGRMNSRDHPIRTGGGSGLNYQTLLRIPDAVKEAIRTSKGGTRLVLRVYVTQWGGEISIGHHRENNGRPIGATGVPWYAYNESVWNWGTGWVEYEMTNWFMPNFLNGTTTGPVLYSANGARNNTANGIGVSKPAVFRVYGRWNDPPSRPTNVFATGNYDSNVEVSWDKAHDPDGDSLQYDVQLYTQRTNNYSAQTKRVNRLSTTFDITNEPEGWAQIRVRAYDGEFYSNWIYSNSFTIRHIPPTISPDIFSYRDVNDTITAVTGDGSVIVQNQSNLRVDIHEHAEAASGKSIDYYIVSVAGEEQRFSGLGYHNFGKLDVSTNQTLRVTAVDTAGLRASATKTVRVVRYEKPDVQYSAKRTGSLSDEVVLSISGSVSPVRVGEENKNSITRIRYRTRVQGGIWGSWQSISYSGTDYFTGNESRMILDNTSAWEIEIEVTDRLDSRTVIVLVGSGKPILFVDKVLEAVAHNHYPTNPGAFEFQNNTYIDKDGELFIKGFRQDPDLEVRTGFAGYRQGDDAGSTAVRRVEFNYTFREPPHVVVSLVNKNTLSVVENIGVDNVTTTGFDLAIRRTNQHTTSVHWIAVAGGR